MSEKDASGSDSDPGGDDDTGSESEEQVSGGDPDASGRSSDESSDSSNNRVVIGDDGDDTHQESGDAAGGRSTRRRRSPRRRRPGKRRRSRSSEAEDRSQSTETDETDTSDTPDSDDDGAAARAEDSARGSRSTSRTAGPTSTDGGDAAVGQTGGGDEPGVESDSPLDRLLAWIPEGHSDTDTDETGDAVGTAESSDEDRTDETADRSDTVSSWQSWLSDRDLDLDLDLSFGTSDEPSQSGSLDAGTAASRSAETDAPASTSSTHDGQATADTDSAAGAGQSRSLGARIEHTLRPSASASAVESTAERIDTDADESVEPGAIDHESLTTSLRKLHRRVLLLWAIESLITATLAGVMVAAITFVFFELQVALSGAVAVAVFALGVAHSLLRYRVWRYELREDALYLERGVFTRVRTVVPFVRIQHVDTSREPLERLTGLGSLVVYTAGSRGADVTVPGLPPLVAGDLQRRLKRLAIAAEGEDAV
jgi:hypothetical protein